MNIREDPDHYFGKSYDSKARFCSYWHQINEIISLYPDSVLEVGIGNGFVSNYLKRRQINVVTIDIAKRLNPDVIGSVLCLPFADNSFEVVACFEVLEHLPYEDFSLALSELNRVSSSHVVLSLPDLSSVYRIYIHIPKLRELRFLIPFPVPKRLRPSLNIDHYWNIGTSGYPLRKITDEIKNAGFTIDRNYRIFEIFWHRMFLLKKSVNRTGCKKWRGKESYT